MTTDEGTWLSPEAHERLTKELEYLSGPGRAEIAQKIDAAREEGDLKENGGYHAAREEQGTIEARIRQLEHLLANATVGEADTDTSVAGPGKVVTVQMGPRETRFLLGSREIAGDADIDVFSEASPLGSAVNGAAVGSTVEFTAPNGKTLSVEVKAVEAF
ncbi:transcription elongation factor GreA [Brevibacterium samyangense]|uniref:Transcription elongation factor GreA n=1 Tax=Brevibacterium samyangense TaxID=366888 RepID=A0ABP5ERC1_9MICO